MLGARSHNLFYPEERPAHRVAVDGFWMDEHPATNAEFRRLLKATGYVTVAERAPNSAAHPRYDPALVERMLGKLHALVQHEIGEDRCPFDLDMFGTREVKYRMNAQR
jgi:formylglycine-generating enzyme required for sulfatase activity